METVSPNNRWTVNMQTASGRASQERITIAVADEEGSRAYDSLSILSTVSDVERFKLDVR